MHPFRRLTYLAPASLGPSGACLNTVLIFDGRPESCPFRECVLFIGTQFSILYTSVYSPAGPRPFQESAASVPRQGRLRLGSGKRGCLLRHATSSRRQGGQEHRDIWKRHSLNKCRGLREERPPSGVRKRVGNNIRTAGTDREQPDSSGRIMQITRRWA